MLSVGILLVGFALLVWGADHFVAGASSLATRLGVPALIIGLTVVAFGTSAPELTVSITAGMNQANEIAISNVLGSNIFNLLIVAGSCAILSPLVTERELLRRDWPASIVASLMMVALVLSDGILSRIDGVLLLVAFSVVIFMQIRSALKNREEVSEDDIDANSPAHNPMHIGFDILVGLAAIIIGGQFAVDGATDIARMFGLSETIIGLTVVAIGTSLPELVTSIAATRRGENSIAIGNVIGSNVFNIFLILGVSSILTPIPVLPTAIMDAIILSIVSAVLLLLAMKNKLNRKAGIVMVITYVAYTAWILMR